MTTFYQHKTNNQERERFRQHFRTEMRPLPSYAERFSFLRECVRDGILTESEKEQIEEGRQVYQAYDASTEQYMSGLVTPDEVARMAREEQE